MTGWPLITVNIMLVSCVLIVIVGGLINRHNLRDLRTVGGKTVETKGGVG